MKKIIFAIGALLFNVMAVSAQGAGYSIEVKPFTTTAGVTTADEKCMEICINYGAEEQANMAQFTMTLPAGLTLDEDAMVLEEGTYFPKKGRTQQQPFQAAYKVLEDGTVNVAISTTTDYFFTGHSGVALMAYYLTAPEMEPGEYDIKITNGVIAIPAAEGNGPSGLQSTAKVTITGSSVGIKTINAEETNEGIYDLSGRRVSQVNKGIYIINGKKVVF